MSQLKPSPALQEDHSIVASAVQDQLREHLSHLKSDVVSWHSLQQQIATLREEKALTAEQLKARDVQLAEVSKRLGTAEQYASTVQSGNAKLLEQLQAHTASTGVSRQQEQERNTALAAEVERIDAALSTKTNELEEIMKKYAACESQVCLQSRTFRRNTDDCRTTRNCKL